MSAMAALAPAVRCASLAASPARVRRRARRSPADGTISPAERLARSRHSAHASNPSRRPDPRPSRHPQARFGARQVRQGARAVVVAAVTEPATEASDKPKPKRKFVKKNVTVQDADIAVGNEYKGKVVRRVPYF